MKLTEIKEFRFSLGEAAAVLCAGRLEPIDSAITSISAELGENEIKIRFTWKEREVEQDSDTAEAPPASPPEAAEPNSEAVDLGEQGESESEMGHSDAELKGGKLAQNAAMLCAEKGFQTFMEAKDAEDCRNKLCRHLGVESRRELDHKPETAAEFRDLKSQYQAWLSGY